MFGLFAQLLLHNLGVSQALGGGCMYRFSENVSPICLGPNMDPQGVSLSDGGYVFVLITYGRIRQRRFKFNKKLQIK